MASRPSGPFKTPPTVRAMWCALATAVLVMAYVFANPPALRADEMDAELAAGTAQPLDLPMLLEADELIFNYDRDRVSAVGNVEVYYLDYHIQADSLEYEERSGRLTARGNVRIIEPAGNVLEADEIDLTDDFRDGFLKSLRVRTPERARFAARSAERRDGNITVFRRGVYTACEPCEEHPERPPFWQIKASKIVHNEQEQTIEYENATLEIMGVPVAYWPYFFHPDSTVKRKSGFLAPSFSNSDALGIGVETPYFLNLAPNYDVTFSPTVYSKQGLLGQLEWRHRLVNGAYSVRAAGIFQMNKDEFIDESGRRLSGHRRWRGSLQTKGTFAINSRWQWGWDITATSDRTFGRDYSISEIGDELEVPSTVYLTGMSERNYFDIRGYAFRVQREDFIEMDHRLGMPTIPYTHDDQLEQAIVHPVADHNFILDYPVFGGEFSVDSNVTSLSRIESDIRKTPVVDYYAGIAGTFARASTDVAWQRRLIAPGGHVVTPFAYVKGELNYSAFNHGTPGVSEAVILARAMPAVGVEYEWPIIAYNDFVTHTFGPIAQVIVRPNETHVGKIPNEDAQSLVFDDTNLFERDKFSGYDRMEGGTRANLGFSYQARFQNGVSVDALIGQSFNLGGENSFALADPALTGAQSGLDTDTSDIVGRITVDTGHGLAVTARSRLDDETYDVRRAEVSASAIYGRSAAKVGYAFIEAQPIVGIVDDRREISGAGQLALDENWSVSGSLIYDLQKGTSVERSFGVGFDNECFNFEASYSQTFDRYSDTVTDRKLFVRMNFRTITQNTISRSLGGD